MRLIPITKLVNHEVAYLIKELWEAIDNTNKRLDTLADDNEQLMAQISAKAEQPKPLLADARKGDLVRLRNGKYSQIVEVKGNSVFKYQNPEVVGDVVALFWCDENGDTTRWGKIDGADILSTEPLAPEGSREWAWQMMLLGNKVTYGSLTDSYWLMVDGACEYRRNDNSQTNTYRRNKTEFLNAHSKTYTWHLYEPDHIGEANKKVETCPTCNGTGKVEKPDPAFKVGDWVEMDYKCTLYHRQVISVHDNGIRVKLVGATPILSFDGKNNMVSMRLVRKLSPSEVEVDFGCLKGRVRATHFLDGTIDESSFIILYDIEDDDCYVEIDYAALTNPATAALVRELIEKQEGDAK